ncbi:hypothetical protein [Serratia symbiotica]|uniref:hypothetical protein n=1 Tax=Serratia symbiotica TaxID=138074 RepID=UPI0013609A25|nr:hypothetical protein [Serratia symbiotica]MBQ0956442.1 hypothetical protein [Serratia symbiotica]
MALYICGFIPKKSALANGTVALAIAVEAKNEKLAEMKASVALEESFPDSGNNYFKPKISLHRDGIEHPSVNEFDEEWMSNHTWNEENKCFDLIVAEDPNNKEPAVIFDLPADVRIAYIVMYGAVPETVNQEYLSNAYDMLNDEEAPEDIRAVIDGLCRVTAVKNMFPASVDNLLTALRARTPPDDNPDDVQAFAEKWVATRPGERESTERRTYDLLDLVIALALNGVKRADAKASDVKNARALINGRDQTWRMWSASLRVIVDILDVDDETIFELVSAGMKFDMFATDAALRKAYIQKCLKEHCGMVFEETTQLVQTEEQQEAKTTQQTTSNEGEKTEVRNLGGGKFSIDDLIGSSAEPANDTSAPNETEKPVTEHSNDPVRIPEATPGVVTAPCDIAADNFQQRATQVEKEIADQPQDIQDNLSLWRKLHRTDERFTKAFATNGGGTSINGTYMVMQATKVLGPQGINWKIEILEERFDNGAPIMRSVKGVDGNFVKEVIPNGAGGYLTEVNHTTKVRLWYVLDGKQGEIFAYGCTPYIYNTKNGLISDGEAPKKSLTDATKKALSQLGSSADVFLGLFDDQQYRQENAAQFAIENAGEKAGDTVRIRKELDEKITKVANTIESAVTPNEAKKVYETMAREVDVHRKNAESTGDSQHSDYLKKRLLSLHKLTEKRIAELEAQS